MGCKNYTFNPKDKRKGKTECLVLAWSAYAERIPEVVLFNLNMYFTVLRGKMSTKIIQIWLFFCIVGMLNSACSGPQPTNLQATTLPSSSNTLNISGVLDYEVDPLYGLFNLQRGFSPDPHVVGVGAGGTMDTSAYNLACGYTTEAPTLAFTLSGGASEGFLRIYFVSSDNRTDTKLIVHTPNQEWICKDNSSNNSGAGPVIDFEYAVSGKYSVWVGMPHSEVYAPGMLFITQSADNHP